MCFPVTVDTVIDTQKLLTCLSYMGTIEMRSHRGIMLLLVLFISTLDQTIVATAIPGIGEALGDIASAPWIATAYLLTSAVTTLIIAARLHLPVHHSDRRVDVGGGVLATVFTTAAFFWTVPFMGLALPLALVMREQPLSDEMIEVAAGKVEVAEY
jgi:MFS family permease